MSERPEFTEDMAREALAQPAPAKWAYTPTTEDVRSDYAAQRLWVACNLPTHPPAAHAEFDRWFAEEIRKAKEEAWKEGYQAGSIDGYFDTFEDAANPYRENK